MLHRSKKRDLASRFLRFGLPEAGEGFFRALLIGLRRGGVFDFYVAGSQVEEQVAARVFGSDVVRLAVSQIDLEFYRLVFRVVSAGYRIRAGHRIRREIRSIH